LDFLRSAMLALCCPCAWSLPGPAIQNPPPYDFDRHARTRCPVRLKIKNEILKTHIVPQQHFTFWESAYGRKTAMMDAKFEKLCSKMQRYWDRSPYPSADDVPDELWERYCSCRDCGRVDPEYAYTVKDHVWWKAMRGSPVGWKSGGLLCLACLAKRLGRPLVREDFLPWGSSKPIGQKKI